jgi:hypothetical protein
MGCTPWGVTVLHGMFRRGLKAIEYGAAAAAETAPASGGVHYGSETLKLNHRPGTDHEERTPPGGQGLGSAEPSLSLGTSITDLDPR